MTLPIVIPIEILNSVYSYIFVTEDSSILTALLPVAIILMSIPVYGAALVVYISSAIEGKSIDVINSWKEGLKFYFPYLAMMILVFVAICAGLILLIIPGIVIGIRCSFASFDLVLNRSNPVACLKNSWALTKGRAWLLLMGGLVIMGWFYLVYFVLTYSLDPGAIEYWVISTASNIFSSVLAIIYTIFIFRVYWMVVTEHQTGEAT